MAVPTSSHNSRHDGNIAILVLSDDTDLLRKMNSPSLSSARVSISILRPKSTREDPESGRQQTTTNRPSSDVIRTFLTADAFDKGKNRSQKDECRIHNLRLPARVVLSIHGPPSFALRAAFHLAVEEEMGECYGRAKASFGDPDTRIVGVHRGRGRGNVRGSNQQPHGQ